MNWIGWKRKVKHKWWIKFHVYLRHTVFQIKFPIFSLLHFSFSVIDLLIGFDRVFFTQVGFRLKSDTHINTNSEIFSFISQTYDSTQVQVFGGGWNLYMPIVFHVSHTYMYACGTHAWSGAWLDYAMRYTLSCMHCCISTAVLPYPITCGEVPCGGMYMCTMYMNRQLLCILYVVPIDTYRSTYTWIALHCTSYTASSSSFIVMHCLNKKKNWKKE